MKNSIVLLAVVLSVAAFAGMMRIKTDVQTMDRERMKLVNQRAELRETKRVLEAEWALLASPEHMAKLVRGRDYVPATALDVVPLVPVSGSVPAVSGTLPVARGVSVAMVISTAQALASASGVVSAAVVVSSVSVPQAGAAGVSATTR